MSMTVGSPTVLRGHTGAVRAVAFSSDGSKTITASDDGTRASGGLNQESLGFGQHLKTVQSVAFSRMENGCEFVRRPISPGLES